MSRSGASSARRSLLSRPLAAAGLAGLLVLAVIGGWLIWQPLRSANADAAAITALSSGDAATALDDARTAAASDPLSPEPLWELSAIDGALGRPAASRAELLKAIDLQPNNGATWRQLGFYELAHGNPTAALRYLGHSLSLDGTSLVTQQAYLLAAARQGRSARRRR